MAAVIALHGNFNFVLSNGEFLLARCSTKLHLVIREYPFATASLADCELQLGSEVIALVKSTEVFIAKVQ